MFRLSDLNTGHFRILVCLPLLLGVWSALIPPRARHITEAWPDGPATFDVGRQNGHGYQLNSVEEHHTISADRVAINEATHAQLMLCPGIGSKTAALIVRERKFGKFYDWRDLHDRVKGMSNTRIENLQEAGVKLNAADPPVGR
jgi:hypothetical protein